MLALDTRQSSCEAIQAACGMANVERNPGLWAQALAGPPAKKQQQLAMWMNHLERLPSSSTPVHIAWADTEWSAQTVDFWGKEMTVV